MTCLVPIKQNFIQWLKNLSCGQRKEERGRTGGIEVGWGREQGRTGEGLGPGIRSDGEVGRGVKWRVRQGEWGRMGSGTRSDRVGNGVGWVRE